VRIAEGTASVFPSARIPKRCATSAVRREEATVHWSRDGMSTQPT
jgi:hypothetical protein